MKASIDGVQIINKVRAGGGEALTAMASLMNRGLAYPGDVADVRGLLKDTEPISFGYAPSDLAWAYLDRNGLEAYGGDRWQVRELMSGYQGIRHEA